MKNLCKKLTFIYVIGLLLISCSKDDSGDRLDNQIATYNLVSNEGVPGEVVEIKSNKQIVDPELKLMLGDKSILAYANGDYSYVFIMPILTPGNYSIKFSIANKDNYLNLKVNNYVAITKPEEVINTFIVDRDKCFDEIKKNGSTPETLLLIDQIKQEWDGYFDKYSVQDKMLLAYILQKNTVNPEWFNVSSEYPESYYNKSNIFSLDAGEKLVAHAKVFVTAQTVCLASIPVLVGTGAAFLYAPNFLTGGVFIAAFTVFIVSREVAIMKAQDVGRLKGVAEAVSDISYQKTLGLELVKDVDTDISMKINFRNLKATDINIQTDITKAFNEEKKFTDEDGKVKVLYDKAVKFTEKLKGLYVSHTSLIGKAPEHSMILTVLDKDIIVQGSSDANVKISTSLNGDVRKIKATSTSTEDINFNLKIAYKRAVDGKEITKEIPCIYKAKVSLIGTWELESFEGGVPIGQFVTQFDFSGCPNIAIQKYSFLSGTIVFDSKTINEVNSSKYVFFNKQIDYSNCSVKSDEPDTEKNYNDNLSYSYVVKGNTLELTSNGYTDVVPYSFITENKINFGGWVCVRK